MPCRSLATRSTRLVCLELSEPTCRSIFVKELFCSPRNVAISLRVLSMDRWMRLTCSVSPCSLKSLSASVKSSSSSCNSASLCAAAAAFSSSSVVPAALVGATAPWPIAALYALARAVRRPCAASAACCFLAAAASIRAFSAVARCAATSSATFLRAASRAATFAASASGSSFAMFLLIEVA